jgi:nicotinamidase-related amidase
MDSMITDPLPIPAHYESANVDRFWRVPYQERFKEALEWAKVNDLSPAVNDSLRTCLVLVDVQNTFCLPEFELFVAGRSGKAAVEDNKRLCEFIYRNLHLITEISPTMDTHQALQIFHSIFFVDEGGSHPPAYTLISEEDIHNGRWKVNPAILDALRMDEAYAQTYIEHYVHSLRQSGKFDLTIWPFHAMLGGIGHALVSAVEEAIFFHSIARYSQPDFQIKGDNPLSEHYSVLQPEVMEDFRGEPIGRRNDSFFKKLTTFDRIVIAGQAKSHCVAWTIADLLEDIRTIDERLAGKIYLLEDCTSSIVIPGVVDYTEQADRSFLGFKETGMNVVQSTVAMDQWPGIG